MPEFILNGKTETGFNALPEIAQGFIEAMFFTESSSEDSQDWFSDETQEGLREGTIDGNLPANVGFNELHSSAISKIIEYCANFEIKAGTLLDNIKNYETEDYDMNRVGNDLWYTSNGHGVGFWDRKELDLQGNEKVEYERLTNEMVRVGREDSAWQGFLDERKKLVSLGDKLSALCRYNEFNTYYSEDGFVYLD